MPIPWSNYCQPIMIANSLKRLKIHISNNAHKAVLIFLIITNFIKAPANKIEIILFNIQ